MRQAYVHDAALAGGGLTLPDGVTTRWRLRGARPGGPGADEAGHAGQLLRHWNPAAPRPPT